MHAFALGDEGICFSPLVKSHVFTTDKRMEDMNGKEKLRQALNHRQGPVPIDFGSTAVTGIHCSIIEKLRDVYGLEKRPVKVHEPYQMLGYVDDDLLEAMQIDIVGIFPRNTMFGFPIEGWKDWKTPWGQNILVPTAFEISHTDADTYIYPQGDRSVPPSGHMPEGGYFFDTIIRQPPFDEDNLTVEDNVEEFGFVSEKDIAYYASEAKKAGSTGKGVIANFGGTAFGDISMVTGPNLKHPKGIRDITEWYISTVARPDYVHSIFARQAEIALANFEKIFAVAGNSIDAVFICGTDFGTQTGQFCSEETFTSLYAPYYRKINDWVHAHTTWKTFKHSCGAVRPLISSFVEAGFDILNPVQCSATGMDPQELKDTYGKDLTFWGGGVDTQKTLPFGSPDDVRKEVLSRLEIFSKDGGYVFNAIHNLQAATPIRNIEAMMETVHTFNR